MPARLSQYLLDVVQSPTSRTKVAQHVVEVLWAKPTPSPPTPTGAGVSQSCVEVLMSTANMTKVSQYLVEVLVSGDESDIGDGGGGPPSPVTHVFGWAG